MKKTPEIRWLSQPAESDYAAAESYLNLLYKPKDCRRWIKRLRRAEISVYSAKDILRASATSISEVNAFDWSRQREEIAHGQSIAPILMVRQVNGRHLLIADGFHRMCALFAADEQVSVHCKIVQ